MFTKRWARRRLHSVREVEVRGRDATYRFICENLREFTRSAGMFLKEPGTCAWIETRVKPGDVFYDVGANIGIYSILAGHRVGPNGRVVAFEPHAGNFAALSRNIDANGFAGRIIPCNFALHRSSGFFDFNYSSLAVGSSRSQLGGNAAPGFDPFEPVVCELKYATSIDDLVASGRLPRPTHVKIDVDGNERQILEGMQAVLTAVDKPKSLSVEVSFAEQPSIERSLGSWGYRMTSQNLTRAGERKRKAGSLGPTDCYNAIFEPI
jgi:FkbM family methyltransferase